MVDAQLITLFRILCFYKQTKNLETSKWEEGNEPGVVAQAFNHCTMEAEAGRSLMLAWS